MISLHRNEGFFIFQMERFADCFKIGSRESQKKSLCFKSKPKQIISSIGKPDLNLDSLWHAY